MFNESIVIFNGKLMQKLNIICMEASNELVDGDLEYLGLLFKFRALGAERVDIKYIIKDLFQAKYSASIKTKELALFMIVSELEHAGTKFINSESCEKIINHIKESMEDDFYMKSLPKIVKRLIERNVDNIKEVKFDK